MLRSKISLSICAIMLVVFPSFAGQFLGAKGYLHTNAAMTLPPGALDISLFARGYVDPLSDIGYTLTNGTSALSTSFGFSRHLDLGFSQVLYQDLNLTVQKPSAEPRSKMIPGDTYVRFKFGNYPIGSKLLWGIMPSMRYRVGQFHDVHLEPYESEGIELELMGLFSYSQKPLYPDEGLAVHLNLGYLNHNDGDTPLDAAQSVNFLASFLKPRKKYDYGLELYGSMFIKRPSESTFSREDWVYITPMVRYKLFAGLHFIAGLDILVLGHTNTTKNQGPLFDEYPNYSSWRLSGRINFTPSTEFYAVQTFAKPEEVTVTGRPKKSLGSGVSSAEFFDRQAMFRWAIEERAGEAQMIDLDIEKIRQERQKAEEELKRLKKELEEKQVKGSK